MSRPLCAPVPAPAAPQSRGSSPPTGLCPHSTPCLVHPSLLGCQAVAQASAARPDPLTATPDSQLGTRLRPYLRLKVPATTLIAGGCNCTVKSLPSDPELWEGRGHSVTWCSVTTRLTVSFIKHLLYAHFWSATHCILTSTPRDRNDLHFTEKLKPMQPWSPPLTSRLGQGSLWGSQGSHCSPHTALSPVSVA